MDVRLSIGDQKEIWERRRQKLEALKIGADPSQQQHDPPQRDNILAPQLSSVAKKEDVDKFIKALKDHCAKEKVSLPVLLGRRSPLGNTLLHAAAETDDNVRAIIEFVPEHLIYCENSRGETPLHIAARAGKAVAVELLLRHGVPIDPDRCGNSALHEAVRNCHLEVIGHLVSKDPSLLYCQNNESKSPLCVAVETGNLKVLQLLLDALDDGEDWRRLESQRIFGMSPVHVALIHLEMDMLIEMWEKKPWLFQLRDAGHGTPLHLAVYDNYLDGVKFLMEKCPTSALEQDSMGYLPIHVACMMDRVEIVEVLLSQWQDPAEFLTRLGQNILHVSARHRCIATVEYILENPKFGHLINARDFDGNTSLHLAALHCQPSVLLLARDKRVNLKLVNKNNMTAYDVAKQEITTHWPPIGKLLTWITVERVGTPASKELAICKPTGRNPPKRLEPPEFERIRDHVNTLSVIMALVASVTFTSGLSVPGGYNGSDGDAGVPLLLHKAMYKVFVTCNAIALYSSIMALVLLFMSSLNDPYMKRLAIVLSLYPLTITFFTMPLAFMAGVYVTETKVAWLSIFLLVLGSVALFGIWCLLFLRGVPYGSKNPLIRFFTDKLLFRALVIALKYTAGSEIAGSEAASVRATQGDTIPPQLE
ncbi:hypothetical protein ACJRO7_006371 [Eucalyptus globulus]|uniref:PGG domain-containing protein n=1 Tax=Eucalyptus globulus TaxID=34317 RepID=A0ABD3IHI8_EUCGL